jgi:hypothetical protein
MIKINNISEQHITLNDTKEILEDIDPKNNAVLAWFCPSK